MKKLLLSLLLLVSLPTLSQSINDYQYVIVPIKFDFLKENDRYRLNTTTKFLLQKYGFKSFLSSDQAPTEATNDRCAVLYASLVNENSFFITKIKLVLKDCQEKTIFETDYGTSRLKDFSPAYNEALREAFKSFEKLDYQYNEGNKALVETVVPEVSEKPIPKISTPSQTDLTSEPQEVFFFAQPTANGYQVVDSEPKVIMRLFKTSQKNVFMADKNGVNGTVLNKEGKWFFEYYANGNLVSEPINLKF